MIKLCLSGDWFGWQLFSEKFSPVYYDSNGELVIFLILLPKDHDDVTLCMILTSQR